MPCRRAPAALRCAAPRAGGIRLAGRDQGRAGVAVQVPECVVPNVERRGRASVAAGRLDVGRGGAGSGYLLGRGACMRRCTAMARRQRHVAVPVRGGRGGSDLAPGPTSSLYYLQLWSHGLVGAVREHTVPRQRGSVWWWCAGYVNAITGSIKYYTFTDVAGLIGVPRVCCYMCTWYCYTQAQKQDPTITACIEWIIQHEPRGRLDILHGSMLSKCRDMRLWYRPGKTRAQWCNGAQSTHPLEARLLEFHAAPVDLCRP